MLWNSCIPVCIIPLSTVISPGYVTTPPGDVRYIFYQKSLHFVIPNCQRLLHSVSLPNIFVKNPQIPAGCIILPALGILFLSPNSGGTHAGKSRDLRRKHIFTEPFVPCGNGYAATQGQRRRPSCQGKTHRRKSSSGAFRDPAF